MDGWTDGQTTFFKIQNFTHPCKENKKDFMPIVKCMWTQDRRLAVSVPLTTVWGWKSLSCWLCFCESVWLESFLLPVGPQQAQRSNAECCQGPLERDPFPQLSSSEKKDCLLNWLMTRWFSKGHWILKTFQTTPAPPALCLNFTLDSYPQEKQKGHGGTLVGKWEDGNETCCTVFSSYFHELSTQRRLSQQVRKEEPSRLGEFCQLRCALNYSRGY